MKPRFTLTEELIYATDWNYLKSQQKTTTRECLSL